MANNESTQAPASGNTGEQDSAAEVHFHHEFHLVDLIRAALIQ